MDAAKMDKKISKAVTLVSASEKYQTKLFIFLCFCWSQLALSGLLNPMVFTNPLFFCEGVKSTEAYSCSNLDKCEYRNNFTGTFFAGLYCENRNARMTLQTIFAAGCILGVFLMPMISDLKGKKMTVRLCLLQMLTGAVLIALGIHMKNYLFIGIGQFLSPFGSLSLLVITYSINSDFFSETLRQKAVLYYCVVWGLTDMSIILVYNFQPHCMFFLIFLMIVPLLILLGYFHVFFLQTPNYFINSKQDYASAIHIIQQLSVVNQATEAQTTEAISVINEIEQIQTMITPNKQPQKSAAQTVQIILKSAKYLKATICLVFIKMAYYSFYYCVQGSLERIGFNFGVSIFLLGSGQFTGYLTGTRFIPKMKRKTVLLLTNLFTAIIGLLCVNKKVQSTPLLVSLVLYICYTLSSYNFSAMSLTQTQSFRSEVRSTVVGIIFGMSNLVKLLIPFTIGYLNERGIHTVAASSAIVLLFGVIPVIFLDETYGFTNLEEPLLKQDTKEMGRIQFFPLKEKDSKNNQ